MPDRYYCETPISGENAVLSGLEAHHLLHVMRAKPGETTVLFDGTGYEFTATIQQLGRSEVSLSIESREAIDREVPVEVVLGIALPKGDRQRWLVEKLTELGCTRLVPITTRRTTVRMNRKSLDKLRRYVIDASKQCGRNRLMAIDAPTDWRGWLDMMKQQNDSARLVAHPYTVEEHEPFAADYLRQLAADGTKSISITIGPEGGLDDAEVRELVDAGCKPIRLGNRVLRIETAAAMAMSLIVAGSEP